MTFTFQAANETRHDRLRCDTCGRWTRAWVVQGLVDFPDPDAVSRRMCVRCAGGHRQVEVEG